MPERGRRGARRNKTQYSHVGRRDDLASGSGPPPFVPAVPNLFWTGSQWRNAGSPLPASSPCRPSFTGWAVVAL